MTKYITNRVREQDITNVFGTGEPNDPVIAFVDTQHTIMSEQWSSQGRWRGWCEEKLEPAEYFKRKLQGK